MRFPENMTQIHAYDGKKLENTSEIHAYDVKKPGNTTHRTHMTKSATHNKENDHVTLLLLLFMTNRGTYDRRRRQSS